LTELATLDDSCRHRNLDPRLGVTWLPSKLQQGGGRTSAMG
jgi:hypothetical protein